MWLIGNLLDVLRLSFPKAAQHWRKQYGPVFKVMVRSEPSHIMGSPRHASPCLQRAGTPGSFSQATRTASRLVGVRGQPLQLLCVSAAFACRIPYLACAFMHRCIAGTAPRRSFRALDSWSSSRIQTLPGELANRGVAPPR